MDSLIAEQHGLKSTADELAEARFELRNAKALADKLQTLLDSKTHEVEALHKEVDNLAAKLKTANNSARHWQYRAEDAERDRSKIVGVLIKHADGDFLVGDPTTLQVAQHIVDKLIADPEPDLETVELKDLIDAVRCFLEDGQAIVIRAESDSVTIQALNEAQFVCSTADARDVLDHATALGLHLVMF